MSNHQSLLMIFKVLFSFDGRMSRSRYWTIAIPFWILFWLIFAGVESVFGSDLTWVPTFLFLLAGIFMSGKCLHDRDRSARWFLLVLIPVVGPIWVFIEIGFLKGTKGENRYGDDPLTANYDYLTVK
ncbi:MAG: DUF805 domain-containing protein [Gammaproteobacteria bacterium]|nr:DUF805 domain-containing protein [Gammaproteobacteria bacterium]